MIVTLTANPSLDRTLDLDHALVPGDVHRAVRCVDEPGGKGVNVARALDAAGLAVTAVLPARAEDPLVAQLRRLGLAHQAVHVDDLARVNLTVTDPDGTTTKLNLPGSPLTPDAREQLSGVMLKEAANARWVVLSGSLPPGAPDDWYATLTGALREQGCRVAVDTSGAPLCAVTGRAATDEGGRSAPDLLKPNAEELSELVGRGHSVDLTDPAAAGRAARTVVERGVAAVLVTLGADGAVLVTEDGAWFATPPPVTPRSTVGAGDSALAGYLIAETTGAPAAEVLALAVAYGTAAAGLPGTAVPTPGQVRPEAVTVTSIEL